MDKFCYNCKHARKLYNEEPCASCDENSRYEPQVDEIVNCSEKVNHPVHYKREGALECIDEMLLIFGVEAVKHFCLLNAWKYRYRAADKNGEEDMRKSDFYLRLLAKLNGADE